MGTHVSHWGLSRFGLFVFRWTTGGRGQAEGGNASPARLKFELPSAKLDENKTKSRLRRRGSHLGLGEEENSSTLGDRVADRSFGLLPLRRPRGARGESREIWWSGVDWKRLEVLLL
jgi:hypothetical protein